MSKHNKKGAPRRAGGGYENRMPYTLRALPS